MTFEASNHLNYAIKSKCTNLRKSVIKKSIIKITYFGVFSGGAGSDGDGFIKVVPQLL